MGMQMHQVDVEPLLAKMGVKYDPEAKFLGRAGKYIGAPQQASVNSFSGDRIYRIKQ
jgi:heterodisulfide reductase subunit B